MVSDKQEKSFHDNRFKGNEDPRTKVGKYYSITKINMGAYKKRVLELCENSRLLEYGCGTGSQSFSWAKNGAEVVGIDISAEGIKKAIQKAGNENVEKVNVKYFHILTLLIVPFRNTFLFDFLLQIFNRIDTILMTLIPFVKRYSWVILIELSRPIKID